MENLNYWNKLKQVPERAKKIINAGRIKGATDIKPQWRIEIMTEVFGPIGIGWNYEVLKQWTEQGSEGQIFAFTNINLYIKEGNGWSKPIFGTGGNKLINLEAKGLYSNDEAFKMSLTDALSVAMKALGVGADVYNGFADSKYSKIEEPQQKVLKKLSEDQFQKALKAVENNQYEKSDLLTNFDLSEIQREQLKHI